MSAGQRAPLPTSHMRFFLVKKEGPLKLLRVPRILLSVALPLRGSLNDLCPDPLENSPKRCFYVVCKGIGIAALAPS